jgi:hypothetical protein
MRNLLFAGKADSSPLKRVRNDKIFIFIVATIKHLAFDTIFPRLLESNIEMRQAPLSRNSDPAPCPASICFLTAKNYTVAV